MKRSRNFYQWDINQKFTECDGMFVDFIINEKDVYRVDIVNGECIIPDEFLQTSGYHTVYECTSDYTIQNHMFPVRPREKPPGYVYTPTEKLTFWGLVQKVDDTVADIIRRADSGEFDGYTPVKGKDYFTEAEKSEMVESVSDGAIGEFREVVDSATASFNKNSSAKTNDYNANAEKKVGVYDSNAAEKLKAYNDNHTEKMTAYDANAADKLSTYNSNAEQKLESYNQNHTEKVAEYNQNAETKTAEFDANADALQTEVDRLRGECDNLAAENRKQENRISALMKLNKGQTYDILSEDGESASRTAPSGSKYVSVDKVGGKSLVWNQLFNVHETSTSDGLQIVSDGQTITMSGNSGSNEWMSVIPEIGEFTALNARNHLYLYSIFVVENSLKEEINFGLLNRRNFFVTIPANYTGKLNFVNTVTNPDDGRSIGFSRLQVNTDYNVRIVVSAYDLTLMFGAGNEPTAEQFAAMFPADSYPYNPGEIISSRTETITAGAETITTGFPELRSAGTAHDVIDLDGGAIRRNVGTLDLGTLDWSYSDKYEWWESTSMIGQIVAPEWSSLAANAICNRFEIVKQDDNYIKPGVSVWTSGKISVKSDAIKSAEDLSGVTLYYEKATPTTEQVAIPELLQEWLPVEAGGTVAFKNADESKQLAVPNAVSWVRKLDEVD